MSFFKHRLRHVPEWEEELGAMFILLAFDSELATERIGSIQEERPMFCSTPGGLYAIAHQFHTWV